MHLTDLDAESQVFARNSLLLTGGLFIVVFLAVFFVLRPVFSSYHTLLGMFDQIRRNPEGAPSVPAERYPPGSEGRQLLSGFRDMLRQVQFSRQQVKDSEAALQPGGAGHGRRHLGLAGENQHGLLFAALERNDRVRRRRTSQSI